MVLNRKTLPQQNSADGGIQDQAQQRNTSKGRIKISKNNYGSRKISKSLHGKIRGQQGNTPYVPKWRTYGWQVAQKRYPKSFKQRKRDIPNMRINHHKSQPWVALENKTSLTNRNAQEARRANKRKIWRPLSLECRKRSQ